MNVISVAQDYVMRMLGSKSAAGMKVLLMDVETAGIVSLVVNQSTALQKEVYLFERIDNPKREPLLYLRCVAFLRPTQANMDMLAAELKNPKYREYHLCLCPSREHTTANKHIHKTPRHNNNKQSSPTR